MAGRAGRRVGKLTTAKIDKLVKPGLYGDGGNLYLKIGESGSRSWVVRFKINGKSRKLGLGPLSIIGLTEAREKAISACRQLLDGFDPITLKHAAKAAARLADAKTVTFDEAAKQYIEAHRAGWKSDKHAAQWSATLKAHASPIFGHLAVRDVDTGLVMRALTPLWTKLPETAVRLRGRIESVLSFAEVHGYRTEGKNPATWRGHLDQLLPARSKVRKVKHFAALPYDELPDFLIALHGQYGVAALALEFTILTIARTSQTINAVWSEIDLTNRMWIIPENRMKAEREHRVPLSDRAIAILDDVKSIRQKGDFLFPGMKRGKPLSNMAMLTLLERMQRDDVTVHGFRSAFRDWCAERTNFTSEVAEMALAHAVGDKVEAAYRRGDLLDKRRRLMDEWASYCTSPPIDNTDNVVPIRA
jgi:integrase